MKGVIYLITSPSGKKYIGQTIDFNRRMSIYRSGFCKSQRILYSSIKKYGFDSHKVEIIESGIDNQEELNKREVYYCELYSTLSPNGMNLKAGGGQYGKYSEESKTKISESKKSPHLIDAIVSRNKLMTKTESWKEKNKKVAELNRNNPDFKKKVSESNRALVKTDQWKKAHRNGINKRSDNVGWRNAISLSRSGKTVLQYDLKTGLTINSFIGIAEAERVTGIRRQHICCCLKGRRKSCGGYGWRYLE